MATSCSVLGMFEANWSHPSTPFAVEHLWGTRAECINKDKCSHECNALMSFSQNGEHNSCETKQNVWILRCNCFALSALELHTKTESVPSLTAHRNKFKTTSKTTQKNHVIFIRNSFQLIGRHPFHQHMSQFAISFLFRCSFLCVMLRKWRKDDTLMHYYEMSDTMYDAVGHRLSKQHTVG